MISARDAFGRPRFAPECVIAGVYWRRKFADVRVFDDALSGWKMSFPIKTFSLGSVGGVFLPFEGPSEYSEAARLCRAKVSTFEGCSDFAAFSHAPPDEQGMGVSTLVLSAGGHPGSYGAGFAHAVWCLQVPMADDADRRKETQNAIERGVDFVVRLSLLSPHFGLVDLQYASDALSGSVYWDTLAPKGGSRILGEQLRWNKRHWQEGELIRGFYWGTYFGDSLTERLMEGIEKDECGDGHVMGMRRVAVSTGTFLVGMEHPDDTMTLAGQMYRNMVMRPFCDRLTRLGLL
jgi:hypothetical protein